MATDKNGNTLARGDIVRLANGNLAEVDEPLTDAVIVSETITQSIDPATCETVATADGRAYATTPPPPPPPTETVLLSEDFSNGIVVGSGRWHANYGFTAVAQPTDPAIVTNPKAGMCGLVHYTIPADGAAHRDHNQFLLYRAPALTPKLIVRGDVLLPANEPLRGATNAIQRKLLYWKSNNIPDGSERPAVWAFLSSECTDPANDFVTLRFAYGTVDNAGFVLWNIARIPAGQWTHIDTEIVLNQPGAADGSFRLLVEGQPEFVASGLDYRLTAIAQDAAYQWSFVEVGRQADRVNNDPVDEDRYWSNIVIAQ